MSLSLQIDTRGLCRALHTERRSRKPTVTAGPRHLLTSTLVLFGETVYAEPQTA